MSRGSTQLWCVFQVVLLRQAKPSGRLVVLVQALTAPKLASNDAAHSSVPAPIQVPPHTAFICGYFVL